MMKTVINKRLLLVLFLILVGCTPTIKVTSTPEKVIPSTIPTEIPTSVQTIIPTMTISPVPTLSQQSFIPTIYRDEINHFQLDYPTGWTLIPYEQIGSRGGQAQVYSPGSTAETLIADGTRFTISVFDWDPKNDLPAYVNQRKTAWDASGQLIISESEGVLTDGRKEMHFIVDSPQKEQTYFLYTIIGERYLQIAGDGDLALLEEIAMTLRPLE